MKIILDTSIDDFLPFGPLEERRTGCWVSTDSTVNVEDFFVVDPDHTYPSVTVAKMTSPGTMSVDFFFIAMSVSFVSNGVFHSDNTNIRHISVTSKQPYHPAPGSIEWQRTVEPATGFCIVQNGVSIQAKIDV